MATIRLSKSGNLYQLAVNGWSKTKDTLNLTVIATNESDKTAKKAFTGNEEIEMNDASIHITAQGYVVCRALERVSDYPVGGMDKYGDDILEDVWQIVLADSEELPFTEDSTEEVLAEG